VNGLAAVCDDGTVSERLGSNLAPKLLLFIKQLNRCNAISKL
jgi:hypothetical protein